MPFSSSPGPLTCLGRAVPKLERYAKLCKAMQSYIILYIYISSCSLVRDEVDTEASQGTATLREGGTGAEGEAGQVEGHLAARGSVLSTEAVL